MKKTRLGDSDLKNLLLSARNGDKDSYREFLNLALPSITAHVRSKVFSPDDVDDVIQDVLFSIHKSLATYDQNRPIGPWLSTITHRKVVDYIRKTTRKAQYENVHETGDVTFYRDETNIEYEGSEEEILAQLPEQMRKPLRLTKIEGYSTKEAAELLGIKENALRTRVSRALKLLKQKLAEW
jgi:RNA polymerase sigma-70 factor (ECF subfamily)